VIDALTDAVSTLQERGHALKSENTALRAKVQKRTGEASHHPGASQPTKSIRREARFALDGHAPVGAREAVSAWLSDAVAAPLLDQCKLIVTELATNSVRHSGMPAKDKVVVRV
jgi:hypothetical protein